MLTKSGREIAKLLAIREREGLTYAELGDRTGVAAATLSWWACPFRREQASGSLLEVEIAESESLLDDSGVSVQFGNGLTVRLDRTFDAYTLRQVVETLADPC